MDLGLTRKVKLADADGKGVTTLTFSISHSDQDVIAHFEKAIRAAMAPPAEEKPTVMGFHMEEAAEEAEDE